MEQGPHKISVKLMIASLGVVYGDIGTSPLYAMSEAFFGHYPLERTPQNVFGVVSLVFWSLILVVTLKYVILVLRADNHGQGGMFALLGLFLKSHHKDGAATTTHLRPKHKMRSALFIAILVGAALLYGEGVITPTISVLSAVEGLSIITPEAKHFELAITVAILISLFSVQKWGTHRIGRFFGPIMMVWFLTLAVLGVSAVVVHPEVLQGLNPWYALMMVQEHGTAVFLVLGSVLLCITGVEALYADLGHFGRPVIARSWTSFVLPCLVLNYLGQGAYLLGGNAVPENHLFYALAPESLVLPMVVLSTAASIIASQALISGSFSLTQQAIALGLFPRLKIVHTNPDIKGQIYIPFVNTSLAIACVWLVLSFKHSANLAAAYGVAVTGAMTVTTVTFTIVATGIFGWRKRFLIPLMVPIFLLDVALFGSALLKFSSGGYVSLLLGFFVFLVMDTWRWGRRLVGVAYQERLKQYHLSVKDIIDNKPRYLDAMPSVSLVVMASRPITSAKDNVPPVLAVHYANWRRLPKHIIFLSIMQTSRPFEAHKNRYTSLTFCRDEQGTVISVQARYGYMEQPDIRKALLELKKENAVKIPQNPKRWLILVGTERFITPGRNIAEKIRIALFSRMNRLAKPAIDYFGLETDSSVVTETINV